jgi:protein-S-isoprenylcysteine O-methyltransferase Ste14
VALTLRALRLRAVWLIVIPFFWFSVPTFDLLVVGAAFAVLGLWIRGWSAGTILKDEELTMTGPYAFTRNPLYFGSFFLGVGVSIAGGHWIWPTLFLLFYVTVYTRTMTHEAGRLAELFPDEYARYAAEVPGFLPRLSPYSSPGSGEGPAGSFRWSRYRRNREWEASLGALAAFGLLAAKAIWR